MSNHVKFLYLLLFFYGVIFVVLSRFFVGVSNFVCESVDCPTVVSKLWLGAHKGSRWGRRHHEGTNMLVQSEDARCTRGDTWCCENRKIKVTFAIWMDKP